MVRPTTERKNDAHMGRDENNFWQYHKAKDYKTINCKILKREIENLNQRGLLKNMIAKKEHGYSPTPREKHTQEDHAQPCSS